MQSVDRPHDLDLETVRERLDTVERLVLHLEARVRELEQSNGEFRRALNRLGDALGATHDRPAMLSAVLETCALYLRATTGVFYGVVAGTESLRPLVNCGLEVDGGELQRGEGVAGTAAERDTVVVWPGDGETPPPAPGLEPDVATAVAVPIRSGARQFGVLALYGTPGNRPFSGDDVGTLATLVRQVEPAIENTFLYEEATRLSITDGLTSLWNRRQFDLRLIAEQQRAVRFGEPFSVVLLDLDQLKEVNDTQGHQAGDAVLVEVASRLASGVRDVDLVARFGGDEFALVLPNTGVAGALRLADKVRSLIAESPFEPGGFNLSVSVGVATFPEHGETGRQLVRAADEALYRAKQGGRNRVEHAHAKVEP
jgi:two-component system cell cycle response regulator